MTLGLMTISKISGNHTQLFIQPSITRNMYIYQYETKEANKNNCHSGWSDHIGY